MTDTPTNAAPIETERAPLRRSLIVDFLLIIVGLSAVIGFVTYQQFRSASLDMVRAHMNTIAKRTRARLEAFIEPTKSAAGVSRMLASGEVIGFHERAYLRALFLAYLQRNRQIQNVYFGDDNGNFLMVERRGDEIRSKRIVSRAYRDVVGKPPTALFKQFDLEAGPFQQLLGDLRDQLQRFETRRAAISGPKPPRESLRIEPGASSAPATFDDAMRGLIQAFPFAKRVYAGFPDGTYHGVTRTCASMPEGGRFTFVSAVRAAASGEQSTEKTMAMDSAWSAPESMAKAFDPRKRPWYRAALETGSPSKPAWTNIYKFQNGNPGVTASLPLYREQGGARVLVAVLGFDLEFMVYEKDAEGNPVEKTLVATFYDRLSEDFLPATGADRAGLNAGGDIRRVETREAGRWTPAGGKEVFYDCRTRPWYRAALRAPSLAVTDVYVFAESRLPGISVSVAARRPGSEGAVAPPIGVVGVDVNVRDISRFLKDMSASLPGDESQAFIIDSELRVVGFPTDDLRDLLDPGNPDRMRSLKDMRGLRGVNLPAMGQAAVDPGDTGASGRDIRTWTADGKRWIAERTRFEDIVAGKAWDLWVVIPEDEFLGPVMRNLMYAALLTGLAALVAVLVAGIIVGRITRSFSSLVNGFKMVEDGEYFDAQVEGRPSYREDQKLRASFSRMLTGLQERHHLLRYVSAATLEAIATKAKQAEHALGGERVTRTLWFSDVRGFTSFSEHRTPEEVIGMLNVFLNVQTKILEKHGGDIDKFVGDEIMCLFKGDDADERALNASFEIITEIEKKKREENLEIDVGIGINSGEVVSGNMGAEGRMDFTVIGDTVNFAARLCDAAGRGKILVAGATWRALEGRLEGTRVEGFKAKGKTGELEVYEVGGWA